LSVRKRVDNESRNCQRGARGFCRKKSIPPHKKKKLYCIIKIYRYRASKSNLAKKPTLHALISVNGARNAEHFFI